MCCSRGYFRKRKELRHGAEFDQRRVNQQYGGDDLAALSNWEGVSNLAIADLMMARLAMPGMR